MDTIEQEILERVSKLDSERKRRVLDFIIKLENEIRLLPDVKTPVNGTDKPTGRG